MLAFRKISPTCHKIGETICFDLRIQVIVFYKNIMKIGEKVKFIDDTLSGVITRIISPEEVMVLVDGLEMPVGINKLIIDDSNPSDYPPGFNPPDDVGKSSQKGGYEVVDLHIEKLISHQGTIERMSASEIKDYQLNKVRRVLKENKRYRGKKITFINGKGDGVLRDEIMKLLSRDYPTYPFQDAPFWKYGMFGALQVRIQ